MCLRHDLFLRLTLLPPAEVHFTQLTQSYKFKEMHIFTNKTLVTRCYVTVLLPKKLFEFSIGLLSGITSEPDDWYPAISRTPRELDITYTKENI